MIRRVLPFAALLALPLGLAGCVVAPGPGYYARPPVTGSVYVGPRPYYSRPYSYRPYYPSYTPRPYYGGWGWRRW